MEVSIVGGGLVGSLLAIYMGNRGFTVNVYEQRPDVRADKSYEGKSINLALSRRGIASLEKIGWDSKIISNGIPMRGRLIHSHAGDLSNIPYGLHGEAILSVDRKKLNEDLLNIAEKHQNVHLHFNHKCSNIDFDKKKLTFILPDGSEKVVDSGLIIGTDGAYSGVRKHLMRKIRMDYNQFYIGHGYKELTIRPTPEGQYRMSHEHLHIWPRHTFMMIALPNLDKSFTCTLFMPFDKFDEITTGDQVLAFFEREFPDAIPLIGQENLVNDYLKNPVGPLVTVKCKPYHYKDSCLILGDASHAMVPFYGQGMNCGFQDVLVLDQLLDKHGNNFAAALEEYSRVRNPDAEAICDLAIHNYTEMRHSVTSPLFLLKKQVEKVLGTLFPRYFIPLYTMVAFTEIPYSEVMRRWKSQESFLTWSTVGLALSTLAGAAFVGLTRLRETRELPFNLNLSGLHFPSLKWN